MKARTSQSGPSSVWIACEDPKRIAGVSSVTCRPQTHVQHIRARHPFRTERPSRTFPTPCRFSWKTPRCGNQIKSPVPPALPRGGAP